MRIKVSIGDDHDCVLVVLPYVNLDFQCKHSKHGLEPLPEIGGGHTLANTFWTSAVNDICRYYELQHAILSVRFKTFSSE